MRPRGERTPALLLLLLAALLLRPAPALAHAVLVRSFPAQGQNLEKAPPWMELQFNEPVAAAFTPLTVRDTQGRRVDQGNAAVDLDDPTRVTVDLTALPEGLYTAAYRITSLDGHPVNGVIAFTVGAAARQLMAEQPPPPPAAVPLSASLTHGLVQVVTALLVGLPLFLILVWRPMVGNGPERPARWSLLLLLLLVGLGAAELSLYGVRASGEPWSAGLLWQALTATRVGMLWLARLGLALLSGFALGWASRARSPAIQWLALLPGLGLLLTLSLQSHAVATRQILPVVMDWLHLLAVAPWIGGLAAFTLWAGSTLAGHPPEERARLLETLVARFSRVALTAVLLLILTGLYGALLHLPGPEALWSTAYGRALLWKLLLLLPVLALAAYNLVRRGRGRFRLAVGAELFLLGAIFLAAGILTSLPPARAEIALRQGPFADAAQAGGLTIRLRIAPNRIGINRAEIRLERPDGAAETGASAGLRLTMLEHEMGLQNVDAPEQQPGLYVAESLILGMGGEWQVEVVALTRGGREVRHTFQVDVPAPP